jgi:hypothetical protein
VSFAHCKYLAVVRSGYTFLVRSLPAPSYGHIHISHRHKIDPRLVQSYLTLRRYACASTEATPAYIDPLAQNLSQPRLHCNDCSGRCGACLTSLGHQVCLSALPAYAAETTTNRYVNPYISVGDPAYVAAGRSCGMWKVTAPERSTA